MTGFLRRASRRDPRECEEVRNSFSDYVDGELGQEVRRRVDVHVGVCSSCGRILSNLVHTIRRLRRLGEAPPSGEEVGERLLRSWRERV